MARALALAALAVLAGTACATMEASCPKQTITVAQKEERSRVEMRRGTRQTVTGGVEETQTPVSVVEYFVRATEDGKWHRVSQQEFKAAAPQQRMEVCR